VVEIVRQWITSIDPCQLSFITAGAGWRISPSSGTTPASSSFYSLLSVFSGETHGASFVQALFRVKVFPAPHNCRFCQEPASALESNICRKNKHYNSFMKNDKKRAFAFTYLVLFLSCVLQAEEKCPVEVKLLLSPPTIQSVIASLGFEKDTATRVYFFDTDALALLEQGVIVRVRQGADNDLTVKVRVPEGNKQVHTSQLREHFPCEIDLTGTGQDTDYSVRRKYKAPQVPEMGTDISSLLSPAQERLLREARVSIDWARVMRIANIKSTKWETTGQPPFRKLTLEMWEWPSGNILELSTKAGSDAGPSKYAELQRIVNTKSLSLSASQSTKTSMILETLTHHTSALR
jgi:hypothetical protein